MKPIVVVGSVNLDLVCTAGRIPLPGETLRGTNFSMFNGGKGANQAVAIGKLGYPVAMVAKVGDDQFGSRLRDGLQRAGVDVSSVSTAKNISSGVALISVDASGQNSIIVVPGANGAMSPDDVKEYVPLMRSAGIILMQLEIPLETVELVAEVAAEHGVPLMLDPAPARELPDSLLRKVTYITPNETETNTLCGCTATGIDATNARGYAESLSARGPKVVVLKLGHKGAFVVDSNGESFFQPAFEVRAVDTTAAGDAFNAGLAVALMRGRSLKDSARFATAVAAISVSRQGAQPSMPSGVEVAGFLESIEPRRAALN